MTIGVTGGGRSAPGGKRVFGLSAEASYRSAVMAMCEGIAEAAARAFS